MSDLADDLVVDRRSADQPGDQGRRWNDPIRRARGRRLHREWSGLLDEMQRRRLPWPERERQWARLATLQRELVRRRWKLDD